MYKYSTVFIAPNFYLRTVLLSYRVMSICKAMGEAVGIAAALIAKNKTVPRAVPTADIQRILLDRGVVLFDT